MCATPGSSWCTALWRPAWPAAAPSAAPCFGSGTERAGRAPTTAATSGRCGRCRLLGEGDCVLQSAWRKLIARRSFPPCLPPPSSPQYDSTFTGHIQPFAHKIASSSSGPVAGCTPRGTGGAASNGQQATGQTGGSNGGLAQQLQRAVQAGATPGQNRKLRAAAGV